MNKLNEEYNDYLNLVDIRTKLNGELKDLVGKNDKESIEKISEIGKKLGEVNTEISKFDSNLINKTKNYFSILKEIEKITEEIKLIEKYSKKITHVNDRTEVQSAEGRKKLIDKEYKEKYQELANQKKELRKKALISYRELEKIISIKKIEEKTNEVIEVINVEPIEVRNIPIYDYDNLSLDEKIEETKKRLDRIFKSAKMPNMGKKILVTYEGKKYPIPEKYKGRYHSTIAELNTLVNKKKKELVTVSESVTKVIEKETVISSKPTPEVEKKEDNLNLYKVNKIVEENKFVPKPVEVTFMYMPKISSNKSFVCVKNKIDIEKIKKVISKLISIYNIDKKVELSCKKIESNLLDKGIKIKTHGVKLANSAIKKYNTTKTFVITVSKNVAEKVTNKYTEFREYLRKKEEIINNIKDGNNIKESMESVYGKDKEKHLDYRIVNRAVKFNENACQRINETKGNIIRVSKNIADKIKEPFDRLRERMRNDIERKELEIQIQKIKHENLMKKEELKRIKIKKNSGYIAMSTLIIVGTIAIAAISFTIIGNLLG